MEFAKELTPEQQAKLLELLKVRFEKNMKRHPGLDWADIQARLEAQPAKLASLYAMEQSGGEPDVVEQAVAEHAIAEQEGDTGEYIFCDCAAESPKGRRSLCYDRAALDARKEHKPKDSAVDMAGAIGVELLTEEQYRNLQKLGPFDTKTSSWVKTPPEIRELDGALFCDYRYGMVFVYHNGASSYYASRGFRGLLRV